MKRKIIGVTIDYDKNYHDNQRYSKQSYYAIRENYINSLLIHNKDLIIIMIPCVLSMIDWYINQIDGLLLIGGKMDISPKYYNEGVIDQRVVINDHRCDFEIELVRRFVNLNKPILGICGGMQLLNVALCGSLYQDISLINNNRELHLQQNDFSSPQHQVNITKNTKLFNIVKTNQIQTNSSHHQVIKNIASDFIINATSEDGLIEGIEKIDHKFCIGIQWHPEYYVTEYDALICKEFVDTIES